MLQKSAKIFISFNKLASLQPPVITLHAYIQPHECTPKDHIQQNMNKDPFLRISYDVTFLEPSSFSSTSAMTSNTNLQDNESTFKANVQLKMSTLNED